MALTKEELMSRVAKHPDIVDIELVKTTEKTTITYKCGHTIKVLLSSLLYQNNNTVCRICNPANNTKKTHRRFLEEISILSSDIEFLERYINASESINFRYKSCGHTHKVSPSNLLKGHGLICRVCNPINKKSHQQFLEEASLLTSDIEFIDKYIGSDIPILFKYKVCGHISKVRPADILNKGIGLICRICNPNKPNIRTNKQFLEDVTTLTSDIQFLEDYIDAKTSITFKYRDCDHIHKVSPNNFLSKGQGLICRICNPIITSKGERAIAELLAKYTEVETSNRTLLKGLEIDIYLPEFKIGIEYNGEYWHSDKYKDRNYHLDKTKLAEEKGIRLIQIFEHEWLQKQEIVKSRLLGMLQQNYKLGARKCEIKEISFSETRNFLDENHLQGAGSPSNINLGLYYYDLLVAVMTFSKPRFKSKCDYELIRYASLTGINVQGGASKLLKYFTNNYQGSILSYSDKRWSQGNLYKTLGFEYSHTSDPDYFYAKNYNILSRYQCQKHKLKDLFPNIYKDELTETDIMTAAGYYKVYGCGNDVWILN